MRIKNGDCLSRMQIGRGVSFPDGYSGQGHETALKHEGSYVGSGCRATSNEPLRNNNRLLPGLDNDAFNFNVILEGQIEQLEAGQIFKGRGFSQPRNSDVALRLFSDVKIGIYRERKTSVSCVCSMSDFEIPGALGIEIDVMFTVGCLNEAETGFRRDHDVSFARPCHEEVPFQREPLC